MASASCPIGLPRSLAALRLECGALERIVEQVRPAQLELPTRLQGGSVQLLLAYLVRSMGRLRESLGAPEPPEARTSWLDYWDTPPSSSPSKQRARAFAQAINDQPVLQVWTRTWQSAVSEAEVNDPARVLISPRGPIRLDHFATTRVLDVTLHGLDLRHALELEEVATPLGLEVTTAVLEELLAVPRPAELRDDVRFVLAAAGRVPHDDPAFPVLQ